MGSSGANGHQGVTGSLDSRCLAGVLQNRALPPGVEKRIIRHLGVRSRIQGDAITSGVSKDREPPRRNFGFWRQRFGAFRFRFRQRGIDIIGGDVNQDLTKLCLGGFFYLDKSASRTTLRLEQMIVRSWIALKLPIKHLGIEGAEGCWIGGGDFDVTNGMVCYVLPLSDGEDDTRDPDQRFSLISTALVERCFAAFEREQRQAQTVNFVEHPIQGHLIWKGTRK